MKKVTGGSNVFESVSEDSNIRFHFFWNINVSMFFSTHTVSKKQKNMASSGCPFLGVFCFFYKYKISRKILSPTPKKIPTKTAPAASPKKWGRRRPVESNEVSVGQDVSLAPYKGDSILIGNYAQTFPCCFKKEGGWGVSQKRWGNIWMLEER